MVFIYAERPDRNPLPASVPAPGSCGHGRWCHGRRVEQSSGGHVGGGVLPLVCWVRAGCCQPPLLKCNAKGTPCICSVRLVVFLFFKFFCFCFSLQLLNLYAWTFKPLPYVYPPMGIITVSCRGSVVSRNTQNAVFTLVFPELCFPAISSRETK